MVKREAKTGRAVKRKKKRVEHCKRLSIKDIFKDLDKDEKPDSFEVNFRMDGLDDNDDHIVIQIIRIGYTPCHIGGERAWLVCPNCEKRTYYLYHHQRTKELNCRNCCRLTYESRQRHTEDKFENYEKLIREKRKLISRLEKTRKKEKESELKKRIIELEFQISDFQIKLLSRLNSKFP